MPRIARILPMARIHHRVVLPRMEIRMVEMIKGTISVHEAGPPTTSDVAFLRQIDERAQPMARMIPMLQSVTRTITRMTAVNEVGRVFAMIAMIFVNVPLRPVGANMKTSQSKLVSNLNRLHMTISCPTARSRVMACAPIPH
jgi:hypothetical protein